MSDSVTESSVVQDIPEGTSDSTEPWKEEWLSGPEGFQFYTRTYSVSPPTSPKAIVLFVHGFAEHIGRYEHMHINYPKQGFTLFAYDQRGFGKTALDSEKKSKGSKYGKTSWKWQLGDIEWWIKYLVEKYAGVPVFLMGHSMGGGLVLGFATRTIAPPASESVKLLSGVIASSPLIRLTTPQPVILRWIGRKLANIFPYLSFPADVPAEDLSRNVAANEANLKDPLIKRYGTLRGLDDMLSGGEGLVENDWQHWPKELPVLFVQGTGDKVTSYEATQEFYGKIEAEDKKISLFEGGYHELVHDIDGLPERLFAECVGWIDARVRGKL